MLVKAEACDATVGEATAVKSVGLGSPRYLIKMETPFRLAFA